MQALADRAVAAGVVTRAYGWPAESVQPVCLVVGYPTSIDFDASFGRGSDRAVFPCWVIVGKAHERTTRDAISQYVTGATGIKEALDGDLGGAVQTARVTDCQIEAIAVGAVEYLAARIDVEIYS